MRFSSGTYLLEIGHCVEMNTTADASTAGSFASACTTPATSIPFNGTGFQPVWWTQPDEITEFEASSRPFQSARPGSPCHGAVFRQNLMPLEQDDEYDDQHDRRQNRQRDLYPTVRPFPLHLARPRVD